MYNPSIQDVRIRTLFLRDLISVRTSGTPNHALIQGIKIISIKSCCTPRQLQPAPPIPHRICGALCAGSTTSQPTPVHLRPTPVHPQPAAVHPPRVQLRRAAAVEQTTNREIQQAQRAPLMRGMRARTRCWLFVITRRAWRLCFLWSLLFYGMPHELVLVKMGSAVV